MRRRPGYDLCLDRGRHGGLPAEHAWSQATAMHAVLAVTVMLAVIAVTAVARSPSRARGPGIRLAPAASSHPLAVRARPGPHVSPHPSPHPPSGAVAAGREGRLRFSAQARPRPAGANSLVLRRPFLRANLRPRVRTRRTPDTHGRRGGATRRAAPRRRRAAPRGPGRRSRGSAAGSRPGAARPGPGWTGPRWSRRLPPHGMQSRSQYRSRKIS